MSYLKDRAMTNFKQSFGILVRLLNHLTTLNYIDLTRKLS